MASTARPLPRQKSIRRSGVPLMSRRKRNSTTFCSVHAPRTTTIVERPTPVPTETCSKQQHQHYNSELTCSRTLFGPSGSNDARPYHRPSPDMTTSTRTATDRMEPNVLWQILPTIGHVLFSHSPDSKQHPLLRQNYHTHVADSTSHMVTMKQTSPSHQCDGGRLDPTPSNHTTNFP